jgi:hypothetical protein
MKELTFHAFLKYSHEFLVNIPSTNVELVCKSRLESNVYLREHGTLLFAG